MSQTKAQLVGPVLGDVNYDSGTLYVDSTNNRIGFGITNPQYTVDVVGDINLTGTIRQNGSAFATSRWTDGIGDDIYRLNGDVGIGTTNPNAKLDIRDGDIELSDSGFSRVPKISFTAFSGSKYTFAEIKADENNNFNGSLIFSTKPSTDGASGSLVEAMRINQSGNVGIGVAVPLAKLHIRGSSDSAPCLVLPDNTNPRYSVGFGNTNITGVGQRLDFYAGDSLSNTSNLGASHIRMSLTAVGNLGIGTTDPKFGISSSVPVRLHLYSDSGSDQRGLRIEQRLSTSYAELHLVSNAREYRVGVGGTSALESLTPGNLYFYDADAPSNKMRMYLSSSGALVKPTQPAFLAYRNSAVTVSGGWSNLSSLITTEEYDIGNNYGTSTAGRFVAPVPGRYFFYFGGWSNGNTVDARYAIGVRVNGGGNPNWISGGNYSLVDTPLSSFAVVLNLSQNDYVELFYFSAISAGWGGGHYLYWGGYLLG